MYKRIFFTITTLLILVFSLSITVIAQDEMDVSDLATEMMGAEAQFEVVESVIEFENESETIVGTLTMPDADGPHPIVLLFHGFTGVRDELPVVDTEEGMFSRTARLLAEQGYASLRIDFRGSGESGGAWEDTTFSGQISDAHATVDFVAELDNVDASRIGVLGLSQGGLVASSLAADNDAVTTTILWSPVANPAGTYPSAGLLGEEAVMAGLQSEGEAVDITLPWGAEISLRTPFFEELFTVNPLAEITQYDGPLMVVVGTRDTTVWPQPQSGQAYINYHNGSETLVVLDGDHIFDILATGPEVMDEAVAWTLAWLAETL